MGPEQRKEMLVFHRRTAKKMASTVKEAEKGVQLVREFALQGRAADFSKPRDMRLFLEIFVSLFRAVSTNLAYIDAFRQFMMEESQTPHSDIEKQYQTIVTKAHWPESQPTMEVYAMLMDSIREHSDPKRISQTYFKWISQFNILLQVFTEQSLLQEFFAVDEALEIKIALLKSMVYEFLNGLVEFAEQQGFISKKRAEELLGLQNERVSQEVLRRYLQENNQWLMNFFASMNFGDYFRKTITAPAGKEPQPLVRRLSISDKDRTHFSWDVSPVTRQTKTRPTSLTKEFLAGTVSIVGSKSIHRYPLIPGKSLVLTKPLVVARTGFPWRRVVLGVGVLVATAAAAFCPWILLGVGLYIAGGIGLGALTVSSGLALCVEKKMKEKDISDKSHRSSVTSLSSQEIDDRESLGGDIEGQMTPELSPGACHSDDDRFSFAKAATPPRHPRLAELAHSPTVGALVDTPFGTPVKRAPVRRSSMRSGFRSPTSPALEVVLGVPPSPDTYRRRHQEGAASLGAEAVAASGTSDSLLAGSSPRELSSLRRPGLTLDMGVVESKASDADSPRKSPSQVKQSSPLRRQLVARSRQVKQIRAEETAALLETFPDQSVAAARSAFSTATQAKKSSPLSHGVTSAVFMSPRVEELMQDPAPPALITTEKFPTSTPAQEKRPSPLSRGVRSAVLMSSRVEELMQDPTSPALMTTVTSAKASSVRARLEKIREARKQSKLRGELSVERVEEISVVPVSLTPSAGTALFSVAKPKPTRPMGDSPGREALSAAPVEVKVVPSSLRPANLDLTGIRAGGGEDDDGLILPVIKRLSGLNLLEGCRSRAGSPMGRVSPFGDAEGLRYSPRALRA